MSSITNLSKKFTDIKTIVKELTVNMTELSGEHKLGFLTCDSQVAYEDLAASLSERLDFPVVGGTTFSYPLVSSDEEISAQLTMIDISGMRYSIGITDKLDVEKSREQIGKVYTSCVEELGEKPKMIFLYLPFISGIVADKFIHNVFWYAEEIPVFGGMATDDLDNNRASLFANGECIDDRMIFIALGGDISPVCSVGSSLTPMSEYAAVVTESEENIVKKVDDITFCEYMKKLGIEPESRIHGVDALVQYGPLPCRLTHKLVDDDGIAEIRCITYTNVEEGSAAFSSSLPIGTKVNIGVIQRSDVEGSIKACIDDLAGQMKEKEASGYQYSMIFHIPCVARYFAVLGQENEEATYVKAVFSQKLPLHSYYGYCEIGPTRNSGGDIHNRSHNVSVVMCAI